jgi:hypothetical protein
VSGHHQFPLVAIVLLAGALGPRAAQAQGAAHAPGALMVSPHNSSARVAIARSGGNRARKFDSFSNVSTFGAPESLAPGLGSSFELFGANQDLGIKAAIDPATEWRLAVAERFDRERRHFFGPGGYYLLDGGGGYAPPEPAAADPPQQSQQPQLIVLEQAPGQQRAVPPAKEPAARDSLLPDEGQFTLVLHDGKQLQAVAFTHMKDRIVYISPDGSRRSIPIGDLDPDATVRVNQERGTPLQLPL